MIEYKKQYTEPSVKVVSFRIEQGFAGSETADVVSESPNFETVYENTSFTDDNNGHDYGNYFTER